MKTPVSYPNRSLWVRYPCRGGGLFSYERGTHVITQGRTAISFSCFPAATHPGRPLAASGFFNRVGTLLDQQIMSRELSETHNIPVLNNYPHIWGGAQGRASYHHESYSRPPIDFFCLRFVWDLKPFLSPTQIYGFKISDLHHCFCEMQTSLGCDKSDCTGGHGEAINPRRACT